MTDTDTLLANRLNAAPVLFRGLSMPELTLLAGGGLAFWLPVGVVVALLAGLPMLFVGITAGGLLVTLYAGSWVLQVMKRGKPEGHYQQVIACKLADWRVRPAPVLRRVGSWDIGRSKYDV